jgi:UDP-N-acetylmuramoyl-tripeptide--D-alanyl-D-alanine ligase
MISIEELHQKFLQCTGASTDTRNITEGGMFFALKGPNFNANAFAEEAIAKGSRYAVVDDPAVVKDDRMILVDDVLKALQDLGRHHRRQFDIPVIGITGSNGKTTTKELIHAVLSADRETLATSGNLNNHIGVPLTLLRLKKDHRIAIIEMGANKPGDIKELSEIAEPTHGLITNIGKAHLEGFGGPEGVVRTKTELYQNIRNSQGKLFVNSDDPLLMEKSKGIDRITYGTSSADLTGTDRSDGPFLSFSWAHGGRTSRVVNTKLIGAYNLANALVAVCIGKTFGVNEDAMAQALEAYSPANNRSQFTDTGRNHLVMDAYNANPSSMKVALENFAAMKSDRQKLAILGDMLELGNASRSEHEAVIELTDRLDVKTLFVGPIFLETAGETRAVKDATTAMERLKLLAPMDHLILIKGSRGIKLESVVPVL